MDLLSVFQSPPLFTVMYGRSDLGQVHESSFLIRTGERPVVLLGGRNWVVTNIDWSKRIAYAEPTELQGKSRWVGSGQPLSFPHCQAIKSALKGGLASKHYSRRAREEIALASTEFIWLNGGTTFVVNHSEDSTEWWTFAGLRANGMLADGIRQRLGLASTFDNLVIKMDRAVTQDTSDNLVGALRSCPPQSPAIADLDKAIEELKFSVCLPHSLAEEMLTLRLMDVPAMNDVIHQATRWVLA